MLTPLYGQIGPLAYSENKVLSLIQQENGDEILLESEDGFIAEEN